MTGAIEKVPAEIRWEIATKGLTGAITAYGNALNGAEGEEKYNEFIRILWYEAGKGAKEFADNFGLSCESPRDVEEITELLAIASMGPEFNFEMVEATEGKCVGRSIDCPWHKRWMELGLDFDLCSSGHQGWGLDVSKV